MTVTYQISDKRGDAIELVKVEGPAEHAEALHAAFLQAATLAGLQASVDAFDSLPGAVGAVKQAFPQAEPWGSPPVPPIQHAQPAPWDQPPPAQFAPPLPAAATPPPGQKGQVKNGACVHGQATFREGVGKNGRPYRAYFCPAQKGDPSQCEGEFLR